MPSGSPGTTSVATVLCVAGSTATVFEPTGMAESATSAMPMYTTSTVASTMLIARGTSRSGLAASSAMFEMVSMPV